MSPYRRLGPLFGVEGSGESPCEGRIGAGWCCSWMRTAAAHCWPRPGGIPRTVAAAGPGIGVALLAPAFFDEVLTGVFPLLWTAD